MFTLVSGPFFPHLESALADTIQRIKAQNRRSPMAIVVPSETLRRRVRWVLGADCGLALFDVHVLTFHHLALRLFREHQEVGGHVAEVPEIELVGDQFYEFLIFRLLNEPNAIGPWFPSSPVSFGVAQALWTTIRDLREGLVDAETALAAVKEGLFDKEAQSRLQSVLALHTALQVWSTQSGVGLPDDLATAVLPWVSRSPFLSRMDGILYYGFYDITQVQLSLLEDIARHHTVTVFFPLGSDSAYGYAKSFMEHHLLKAGVTHQRISSCDSEPTSGISESSSPVIEVVNTVGDQGELHFACKAIWHAVEQWGQVFHQIGVVARSLDAYGPWLSRVFREHHLPFWTTATAPLLEDPLSKAWWDLAGLKRDRYPVSGLLHVLNSCALEIGQGTEDSVKSQSHLWWQVVRHFQILGGREDWERLAWLARDSEALALWQRWSGFPSEVSTDVVRRLARLVSELIRDCENLPARGRFKALTDVFEVMVRNRGLSPIGEPSALRVQQENPQSERQRILAEAFGDTLGIIRQLDRVKEEVTWEEWAEEFRRALERSRVPILGQSQSGVAVLDAMSARGYAFDTLLVLGLNDQVFPRVVREDAFLRDRDRRVLTESVGYPVQEKLKGLEEETLLFRLLREAARTRLFLVYQRMDQQGQTLLPSSFLDPVRPQHRESGKTEIGIPLQVAEREHTPFIGGHNTTEQEHRLRLLLNGERMVPESHSRTPWEIMLLNGLEAVEKLENILPGHGAYDGLIPGLQRGKDDGLLKGLSPTRLEQYVQCPMRFWMKTVLETKHVRESVSRHIAMRVWGELGHAVLKEVYQRLVEEQWLNSNASPSGMRDVIVASIESVFDQYAMRYGKGYRVVWEWMQERFISVLGSLIEHDRQEWLRNGYGPVHFEVDAVGRLSMEESHSSDPIKIIGRVDRVDRQSESQAIRIVDYKFSETRQVCPPEPDLILEALRGKRLQPALYALMSFFHSSGDETVAERRVGHGPDVEFRFLRLFSGQPLGVASFPASTWENPVGVQLQRTIQRWMTGLQTGNFFIMPGSYCQSCVWSVACRVQHFPSRSRALNLPLAKEFRVFRKQRVSHGT